MWSVSLKTAGPRGGLVAANALEDAGAVVEAVRADMDGRVVPVDELAVQPDLLGGLHGAESNGRVLRFSSRRDWRRLDCCVIREDP